MGFDKVKVKQVCLIALYIAALGLLLIYSKVLFLGIKMFFSIVLPFIVGGVIAFVLNIPMKAIEKGLFSKAKGKMGNSIKRPVSMILALSFVVAIVTMIFIIVVPQLRITIKTLGAKIPPFLDEVVIWVQGIVAEYPELTAYFENIENLEFNWEVIIGSLGGFLKNGVGNMFGFTLTVAGNIIGGLVNALIALVFAIYILSQKEILQSQGLRIIDAYAKPGLNKWLRDLFGRLHANFTNFICGQCLEAVVLGCLFIIFMTIFRFPYAIMIGTLIGFTSLIPIVGAFIGCGVGAFMILIDDPMQALWFVILFLVLQQIEGNLIYPKVVGNSVGLPSIWVLASVTIGGSLFGVAGMLVFIPLMSTLYSLLRDDVNRRNGVKGGKVRSTNNTRNKGKKDNKQQQKVQEKPVVAQAKPKKADAKAKAKAGKAENTDENSPEQIVARLVAEQEVKVKSELEQEAKAQQPKPQPKQQKTNHQKPAQQKQQDNTAKAETTKTEPVKAEAVVTEIATGEEKKPAKKNNYYRNRNRNYHKKKANTPRT